MPLDNKCRIGPLAGAPPDTCAVVISTETESGFITEDDTSPVCHTPRGRQNPVDTAYDVGSVVSVLADVGSPHMVSLDGTGCLEGGKTSSCHVFSNFAVVSLMPYSDIGPRRCFSRQRNSLTAAAALSLLR
ncbi:hypothetical protein TNCV_391691 [Trichonephila clavipes]|nr:hypothetical protein TNCV_391691 [Trichonephila clavipes]